MHTFEIDLRDHDTRTRFLAEHKPSVRWPGEAWLGGNYGEEGIAAVTQAIRDSMDWTRGFGLRAREVFEFEQAFAAYCGASHCVSFNSAGTAIDVAMRCLDLQPGDEVICPA